MNDSIKVPLAQQTQGIGSPIRSFDSELDALKGRLATLEAAHADLVSAFHRRTTEFESRLDAASAESKEFKTVAVHLAERLDIVEKLIRPAQADSAPYPPNYVIANPEKGSRL
jgi:hypothetical protein